MCPLYFRAHLSSREAAGRSARQQEWSRQRQRRRSSSTRSFSNPPTHLSLISLSFCPLLAPPPQHLQFHPLVHIHRRVQIAIIDSMASYTSPPNNAPIFRLTRHLYHSVGAQIPHTPTTDSPQTQISIHNTN